MGTCLEIMGIVVSTYSYDLHDLAFIVLFLDIRPSIFYVKYCVFTGETVENAVPIHFVRNHREPWRRPRPRRGFDDPMLVNCM